MSLGLTSLNNFGGFWSIGLVPTCLAPGPGIKQSNIPSGMHRPDSRGVLLDWSVGISKSGSSPGLQLSLRISQEKGSFFPERMVSRDVKTI